jgi:hypothetical protein
MAMTPKLPRLATEPYQPDDCSMSRRARQNTPSSISSVNRLVLVFCCYN